MRPFKQLTAYVDLLCEWVSDVKYLGLTANKLAETATSLEHENAKLRELVRDMYRAFMHGNCYRWCEFKEPCNYISDGRCQWYDRMRELGVES